MARCSGGAGRRAGPGEEAKAGAGSGPGGWPVSGGLPPPAVGGAVGAWRAGTAGGGEMKGERLQGGGSGGCSGHLGQAEVRGGRFTRRVNGRGGKRRVPGVDRWDVLAALGGGGGGLGAWGFSPVGDARAGRRGPAQMGRRAQVRRRAAGMGEQERRVGGGWCGGSAAGSGGRCGYRRVGRLAALGLPAG